MTLISYIQSFSIAKKMGYVVIYQMIALSAKPNNEIFINLFNLLLNITHLNR